ncbi:MAG: DUF389 domain-containing protein [Patescibacteria group bacterium]|nr:DUF389 domain-containing protein [Patescibacteria group bacterium]
MPIDMKQIFRDARQNAAGEIRDSIFAKDTSFEEHDKFMRSIDENSRFTESFLALLAAAMVICTLGLLMNSPAVIIGGMIISPIMWPIMKLSAGISFQNRSYVWRAAVLLIVSVIFAVLSSAVITMVSPMKALDAEILARTTPGILDIVVALASGLVGALAMIKPRISENLAGVAIAVSLMPPLCVSGIGIALSNGLVAGAGMFLFIENVAAIAFAATAVFVFYAYRVTGHMTVFRKRGLTVLLSILAVISLISLIITLQR